MALVPRPLADAAPGWRSAALTVLVALGLAALFVGPATADVDVDIARYTEAERAGATVAVAGRAYAERRKPDGPDAPLAGTTVVALPRSEALVRRLEQLRAGARDSGPAYRQAAALIQREREAYERDLWQAGGADLVRTAVVDAEGRFDLGRLPEGRWLLLATRDEPVRTTASPRVGGDTYLPTRRLVGFRSRQVWLREIDVTRSEPVEVRLTDRNVWFSGVVEERALDTGRRR